MYEYAIRRLLSLIPLLLAISLLVFGMLHMVPGDAARVVGGDDARPEDLVRIREQLGLDQPFHVQYLRWLTNTVQGDFGRSLVNRQPVMDVVTARFGNTLRLAVPAIIVVAVFGVSVGVLSAVKARTLVDYGTMTVALLGMSVPPFALGLTLMLVFSIWLGWLPVAGSNTFRHYVLPVVTLAAVSTAFVARITRSAMLEVLSLDYIRTARSKGLREQAVVRKHALRNALLTIITVIGLQFGTLLSGSVITETVFYWPGIGKELVDAIFRRDFPVAQAAILLISVTFVMLNVLIDIAYAAIDPRVRYG